MPTQIMYPESDLTDVCNQHIIEIDSGKTLVYVNSRKFTLIPLDYYSSDLKEQYFSLAHSLANDEVLIESKKNDQKYCILFAIKKELAETLEKKFPNVEFAHFISAFTVLLQEISNESNHSVLIYRQRDHFYLLIRKNGEYVLLNSYNTTHMNDLCYFTLFGLRNAGIETYHSLIWYSGLITEGEEIPRILQEYLPGIKLIPPQEILNNINSNVKGFPFIQTIPH